MIGNMTIKVDYFGDEYITYLYMRDWDGRADVINIGTSDNEERAKLLGISYYLNLIRAACSLSLVEHTPVSKDQLELGLKDG